MKFAIGFALALTAAQFAIGQLPDPNQGPGGPILVITSSSATYGKYYAEILRTEGLNEFAVADIGSVTATTLSAYDVAILAPAALTAAQVSMLTTWVTGGGNLIAMKPDSQLAGLLGVNAPTGTLANSDVRVDTSTSVGSGIVGQTIQFHGSANVYTLNGATSIATLYSNFSTGTTNPAITLRAVGTNGGHAASFAYDLATSIVYSRQGNPAWAAQERDGTSPIRSDDKFYGAATGDPQSDWVDLNNEVAVPQADEQQRLLANLILLMNVGKKPLPRFWYFPRGKKAIVIMTGDDHGNGGTAGRFDQYSSQSPAGCSVDNWDCIRSTSYIFVEPQNLSNTQAASYTSKGFEVGLHINTNCADFTPSSLDTFYSQQISNFKSSYPGIPAPTTMRHHCIAWSDWVTGAKTELKYGIRLDTSYYFWPPAWLQNRPGHFTGSAMPMRFADLDGTIIDVYNVVSQMTDESGQTYPFTSDALLSAAVGPQGYYGAYTINAHTDTVASSESDGVLSSALSRQVQIVSSVQMLKWLDARNSSSFNGIIWSGNTLRFNVAPGSGANGLQAMVPTHSSVGVLTGITGPSGAVTSTVDTIKGIEYALFSAAAGAYTVSYAADTTPPTVSSTSPANGVVGVAQNTTVVAKFSESMDASTITTSSFVLSDPNGTAVAATVAYTPASQSAVLTPNSPLAASTKYTATLTTGVKDASGNALAAPVTWSFTTAAAPSCPCTAFSSSATPANPAVNDPNAVEVGVKFNVDLNGFISGIRFYKGTTNTGTHVGTLWSSSGTKLVSANFVNETASGWQQVNFASPVAVTAGTVYVASYHTAGNYAGDNGGFAASGVDNTPVHLLRDGVSGGNGVYAYGASSAFPANTFQSTNYWVDVVFTTSTAPAPTLTSITVTPANPTIATGANQQFTATGTYSDTSTKPITTQVTWTSSNTAVATINAAGLATGASAGASTITAAQGATTGSTTLTVQPGALSITTASPLPSGNVGTNYSATLAATGGTTPYSWSIISGSLPAGLILDTNGKIAGTPTASGTSTLTIQASDSATPKATTSKDFSIAIAAAVTGCTTNCSIWPSTAAPTRKDDGADSPVELGVKFKADRNGTITGIRFYKASTNTGTHVGHLWTSTGTLLATVTFSGETASGWQQMNFATPVSITANAFYVASYHTTVGHYADDQGFFGAGGVDNVPLHALQDGISGFNGAYAYGAGNFPNQGFNSSNYWVDVVFQ